MGGHGCKARKGLAGGKACRSSSRTAGMNLFPRWKHALCFALRNTLADEHELVSPGETRLLMSMEPCARRAGGAGRNNR
jgi:hypothetical protein